MPLVFCTAAVCAVALIHLFWRSYIGVLVQRRRVLRERVAHMLWIMAEENDDARSGKLPRKVDSSADVI